MSRTHIDNQAAKLEEQPNCPPRLSLRAAASPEARAILEYWDTHPLSPQYERALRMLASKFMREGCCYASHQTLAAAFGMAKSNFQEILAVLKAMGLIHTTKRTGSSNVTTLSPGVKEALEIQRLERLQAKHMIQSYFGATTPEEREEHDQAALACLPNNNRPKALPNTLPLLTESSSISNITPSQAEKDDVPLDEMLVCSTKETTNIKQSDLAEQLVQRNVKRFVARKLISEFSRERIERNLLLDIPASIKNQAGYLVSAIRNDFASSAAEIKSKEHTASVLLDSAQASYQAQLIAEGIEPICASNIVQTYANDLKRLERNIALGEHQTAKNPAGYLVIAIREDYAKSRPKPGSEHAAISALEKQRYISAPPAHQASMRESSSLPSVPEYRDMRDILRDQFLKLPLEQQRKFERVATEEIQAMPPVYLRSAIEHAQLDKPSVTGAIRARAIEIWHMSLPIEKQHSLTTLSTSSIAQMQGINDHRECATMPQEKQHLHTCNASLTGSREWLRQQFALLPIAQRAQFEEKARIMLLTNPPPQVCLIARTLHPKHPLFNGMVATWAVDLWRQSPMKLAIPLESHELC